jgi:phosphohistidine phosphatase
MTLLLMRHAHAGDPDPARYPDDRLRPLTARGVEEHQRMLAALGRLGLRPSVVLTSPLERARQTATMTAQALGGLVEAVDALGEAFAAEALLARLAACPAEATVICVGHEPHLSRFAALMLHPEGTVRIRLARSGVIALECAGEPRPGGARLLFAVSPEELLASCG